MTEFTVESLQAEITRLKAHSDDLLAERKAEKQRREAAENALQTLQEAHSAALTKLDDVTLSGPVLRALEGVVECPPDKGRKLLEDAGIRFQIGSQGVPVAIDADKEIPLPDLYRHMSDKCSASAEGMKAFGWLIRSSGSSGGGAMGSNGQPFSVSAKEPKVITSTPSLGLR